MIVIDTSAVVKLLVEEAESEAVEAAVRELGSMRGPLLISRIGVVEFRRVAIRLGLDADATEPVIRMFTVVRLTEAVLQIAGRLPYAHLGTLDALHLSTALVLEAPAIMTYDERLAEASRLEGLEVLAPGR